MAVAGLAGALGGCAAGPMAEQLPASMGGLPAGAPAPPPTPYEYPAVHDMPPPRATAPMSEEEQVKAEKELQAVRDRQEAGEGTGKKPAASAKPPAKPSTKKQPVGGNSGENTGAKTNP